MKVIIETKMTALMAMFLLLNLNSPVYSVELEFFDLMLSFGTECPESGQQNRFLKNKN